MHRRCAITPWATLAFALLALAATRTARAQSESTLADPIHWYRKAISPLRGATCSMYPSCSHYGEECFARYNFFLAASLTADRLLRCGHAHDRYLWLKGQRVARLIDPPPCQPIPLSLVDWPSLPIHAPARRRITPEMLVPILINQGLHSEALAEFERLALFTPTQLSPATYANALRCFIALDRYADGITFHKTRIPKPTDSEPIVAIQLAKLYILAENLTLARATLQQARQHPDAPPWRRPIYTLEALSYLPISSTLQADPQRAAKALALTKPCELHDSIAYAESLRILHQMSSYRPKSANLAATLSIVPGMGYFYLGHWATGITSLLLNGTLAIATWQAVQTRQWALAGIIGMLNISFYIGGFQGAYRRANLDALSRYQTQVNQLRYINNFQNL